MGLLLAALVGFGCGGGETSSSGAGGSSGSTSGTGGGTGGTAGGAGSGGAAGTGGGVDTSAWDCTATTFPERKSAVPAGCAIDPTCTTQQVSWHRGAGESPISKYAPEETVSALRAALAVGADIAGTIDPRPTKDGVLIAMQDDTVDRVTKGTGSVDQLTLAEIQALALETDIYSGDFSCEKVTTYRTLLEGAKGRIVVLSDLSSYGSSVALAVKDVQDAGAVDWVLFGSETVEGLQQALALEPALHVWINVSSAADLDTKLDALAPVVPAFVILKMGSDAEIKAVADEAQARGTRALTLAFTKDVVANLSGDISGYADLWATGVDAVITNRADFVLEGLGR